MIGLLQRVSTASVTVHGATIGRIPHGLLVFVGIEREDGETQADRLLDRLFGYRVFPDATGKMNLSLKDIQGGLLLVPQFTLAADTRKGMRASFTPVADPEKGQRLYTHLVQRARTIYGNVACGEFGADMQVTLTNDGPVTFWLQV